MTQLSLYLGIIECILFGFRKTEKLSDVPNFRIECYGHTINPTKMKYAEVFIDKFLSGEFIVESILQKVNNNENM